MATLGDNNARAAQDRIDDTSSGFYSNAYRPTKVSELTLCDRGKDEPESRHVLIREATESSIILSESDKLIWDMIDGRRSVKDICSDYLLQYRQLVLTRVYSLIQRLWDNGFLLDNPKFAPCDVPVSGTGVRRIELINWLRIKLYGTEGLARLLAPIARAMRLDYVVTAIGLGAIVAIGLLLADQLDPAVTYPVFTISQTYELQLGAAQFKLNDTYVNGILLLIVLHLVCSFCREMWRLCVEVSFSGRVSSLQLVLNYGVPCLRAPGHWCRALPFGQRLVAGCAGIAFELVAGGICALILLFMSAGFGAEVIYKLMWLFYLRTFIHLSPLAVSDLNAIMADWGNLTQFRRKALGFLRYNFIDAMFGEAELGKDQRFYLTYNLVCVIWIVLAAKFSLEAVIANQQVINDLLSFVVRSPQGILPLLLLLLFALPILISIVFALAWSFYVLCQWLSHQPVLQDAKTLINLSILALIVFVTGTVGLTRVGVLALWAMNSIFLLATALVTLGGILTLFKLASTIGKSVLRLKIIFLWLALALGFVSVIVAPGSPPTAGPFPILDALIILFLVLYLLTTILKNQHVASYLRTNFLMPELTTAIGALLTIAAYCGRIGGPGVGTLDPALPTVIDMGVLIGFALVALGTTAFYINLMRIDIALDAMRIDDSQDDVGATLSRILNHISDALGKILGAKFGEHTLGIIERQVTKALAPAGFSFAGGYAAKDSDQDKIGNDLKTVVAVTHDVTTERYGIRLADKAIDAVFETINWEGKQLLHTFSLASSRWKSRFADDADLDREKRTELVNAIGIFNELQHGEKEHLVRHMVHHRFARGSLIVREGEIGDAFYIVIDGQIQVEEQEISGDRRIIAFLAKGDFFGEAALFENTPRMASIRAVRETRVLTLYKKDFNDFADTHPRMMDHLRDRLQPLQILLRIPLFGDLPKNLLRSILPSIEGLTCRQGDVIIKQGEIGGHFYLIKSGEVEVLAEQDGVEVNICELGVRDFFGEIALLNDVPRTATVRALKDTDLLVLNKTNFAKLVSNSELFAGNLRTTGKERWANMADRAGAG